jgi:hypothetical protein
MKLSVKERLSLLQILPKMDNILTMNIVYELGKKISIGAKEFEELGFIQNDKTGEIQWDVTKEKEKEVEFEKAELDIIKDSLKKLDESKKVELVHISLWDKFMK